MGRRRDRGCNCCGCETFSDDFDRGDSSSLGSNWTELAGDWSISSNELSIADTSAAAQATKAHSSADMGVVVDVTAANSGDKVRVCGRMQDEDNYIAAELDFSGTLALYYRSSGSDGAAQDSTGVSVSAGSTYTITLCLEGSVAAATVADSTGKRLGGVRAIAAGGTDTHAGLATGDTLGSAATFDDFMLLRRSDDCEICYQCAVLPYTDNFSSSDPNWSLGSGTITWTINGDKLKAETTGGGLSQDASRCHQSPTGNVLFSAVLTKGDVGQAQYGGICINEGSGGTSATGEYLRADWPSNRYQWSWKTSSGNYSLTPSDGDVLSILLDRDNDEATFKVNDTTIHTETSAGIDTYLGVGFSQFSTGGVAAGISFAGPGVICLLDAWQVAEL